ncbi:Magnesium transporter [Micractinium conductrix]|uniref:Magnesium transporter n=1 Tax=Micractinium conductrix TaxID=554055 RepID=A0A2P6VBX1_9CHLO|nr:Magnesium transporter [Micractinium conductrix]|eukprot:PSC71584.1 Magnesium transporter [Micractinium conductrix]
MTSLPSPRGAGGERAVQHHRPPRAAMVSPSKQHPPHWRHSSSAGHLGQLGHLPPSGGGSAGHLTTTHHRRPSFQLHAAVDDEVGAKLSSLEEWGKKEAARCDSGDPDLEFCELPGIINTPPAERPAAEEAWSRGRWLLGLLVLQSTSSFVLDSYQELLKEHLVVTLFLTMLVGAGGNAGNQSAIKVIRGLATGAMKPTGAGMGRAMKQQLAVGLMLGTGLAAGGWLRVYITNGDVLNATAISISLFLIVVCSVVAGTGLPFALARAGIDPANAGTSIQVVMDVTGVLLTCATCHLVLDQLAQGVKVAA